MSSGFEVVALGFQDLAGDFSRPSPTSIKALPQPFSGKYRGGEIMTATIQFELPEPVPQDIYEALLRPFWAEAYRSIEGVPGMPGRLKQFLETRAEAQINMERDLRIIPFGIDEPTFEEFLFAYEAGDLPIRCGYPKPRQV